MAFQPQPRPAAVEVEVPLFGISSSSSPVPAPGSIQLNEYTTIDADLVRQYMPFGLRSDQLNGKRSNARGGGRQWQWSSVTGTDH
ncbi:hypothetical protein TYRP_012998 [Tyrophagus putrescentiae]|nr:hypothetical protein TYRP_012998 [Tyrophagus putrescentiae]